MSIKVFWKPQRNLLDKIKTRLVSKVTSEIVDSSITTMNVDSDIAGYYPESVRQSNVVNLQKKTHTLKGYCYPPLEHRTVSPIAVHSHASLTTLTPLFSLSE